MQTDSTPLVSVILPVYNGIEYIGEALESLFCQTLADWECIVVDDGSTDEVGAVVSRQVKRDSRIRYISRPHRGLSVARNEGIRLARGRYLQFLDADDRLDSEKLKRQVEILENDWRFSLVYGEVSYFGEPIQPGLDKVMQTEGREEVLRCLVKENIAPVNCFLIEKESAVRVGLFDETLGAYEDWDLWLRCAVAGLRFKFEPDQFARAWVRLRSSSMIHDKTRMLQARVAVRHKIKNLLPADRLGRLNHRLLARDEGRLAYAELKTGFTANRVFKILRAVSHV